MLSETLEDIMAGVLMKEMTIARQIHRKVLERRFVFVPRPEGDEPWCEFRGEGSLTNGSAFAHARSVAPWRNRLLGSS